MEIKGLIFRVSQNMQVGGVIQTSVSRQEVLTSGCKPLQDKLYLSPAIDKSLLFSCSYSAFSFLSCELLVARAVL